MSVLSQQERDDHNQQAIAAYLKNARKDHQRILARRQTIEERKERLESLNIQREKEELEQREAEMQKVRKAEEERLRLEAKEREKERIMQEHEQIKKKTVRERLEQIKKTELGAKAFKDIDIEVYKKLRFSLGWTSYLVTKMGDVSAGKIPGLSLVQDVSMVFSPHDCRGFNLSPHDEHQQF